MNTLRRSNDPRGGFVLVTVLWSIALLAALAMAASTMFRGFTGVLAIDRDRAQMSALLDAGLEVSAGIIARLGDKVPLTERETSVSVATGLVRMRLTDEMGKIDINKAPAKVLASVLRAAGAGKNADAIAKAILSWRALDQKDQPQQAANAPQQTPPPANTTAGQPNAAPGQAGAPKSSSNHPSFTDIRQLMQIPGMTPELLADITPLITVFGDDKLNAMTASADVLNALPDAGHAQLGGFLNARARAATAGEQMQQMLSALKDYVKFDGPPVASVTLNARLQDGYRAGATAIVVIVPEDTQPYRILAWTPLPASARRAPTVIAEQPEDE